MTPLRVLLCTLTLAFCSLAQSVNPDLVISHVYGAGGNSGAVWRNDFVVVFNRSALPVSLAGKSIQYTSATGTGNFAGQPIVALSGTLAAGQYYLVQMSSGGSAGTLLPAADATGTTSLAAAAGKVVLANTTTGLACNGGSTPCSAADLANIIDLVGYGTANFFEGAGAAPTLSTTAWAVRKNGGCTDTNSNTADFVTASSGIIPNSATALAPCGAAPVLTLSINDVSASEGNSGTTNFNFTVSLNAPAGAGGVTFDIATADSTATASSGDYTAGSLTGQTIPQGQSTYQFTVQVNGDTSVEPNETFFVNVTNVTGATVTDGQGQGTILNDDVTITSIMTIQGSGNTSPLVGATVSSSGVVTAVMTSGYFIQDEAGDANSATSDGLFVFTSSTPPAAAAVGNRVLVTGTVAEFARNPGEPTVTELTGPTTVLLASGVALPAPVALPALTTTGGPFQWERYEGMRVTLSGTFTVIAPTGGTVSEAQATATSNGVFNVVAAGSPLPVREPGIAAWTTPPVCAAGSGCAIPVFDTNPERIRIDSDGVGQPILNLTTGQTVTDLAGILHQDYQLYTIMPTAPVTVGGTAVQTTAIPVPGAGTLSIAAANVERLYDSVNDPGGDVAIDPTAFANRLGKISKAIRDVLRAPDVVALEEVEDLKTLQALAARITADAAAASQPDPAYTAYLVEGKDVGLIDVGFLVRTATVNITDVTQIGLNDTYANPCVAPPDNQETLNDRPSLRLRGTAVKGSQSMPFTLFVNHLRSLNGIDDETSCSNGQRVRAKRAAQANYVAQFVQDEVSNNPASKIILVGDFNAFEVNDGYVDVMGTITGTPAPATQVVTSSNNPSYPDLTNMLSLLPAAQRYSYVFDADHQTLDHVLLNPNARSLVTGGGYARINADFPESLRGNFAVPQRYSDHDPAFVFLTTASNVTSQTTLIRSGIAYNRTALTATSTITVRNNGVNAINGPLQLVINGLPGGVSITNAAQNNGAAYVFNLAAPLNPGQSVVVPLSFSMNTVQAINYTAAVFSGIL